MRPIISFNNEEADNLMQWEPRIEILDNIDIKKL